MYLESSSTHADVQQSNDDELCDVVQLSDSHCRVRVDTNGGTWLLEATHAGKLRLEFNGVPVAKLSSMIGASLLHAEGCPFEHAAEILDALCVRSCLSPSAMVRIELEYALARWIPTYF
jgi:hypothetical protein